MKRVFLLTVSLLFLCACSLRPENENGFLIFSGWTKLNAESSDSFASDAAQSNEIRCSWFSYPELNPNRIMNEEDYCSYVRSVLRPLQRLGITDLFVHIRPFADAIYPSELFESSKTVVNSRGDRLPLDYFAVILREAKALCMRVHAWINPYRIVQDRADLDLIDRTSAVGRLVNGEKEHAIVITNSGVWLQPGAPTAQKLILDGVREILLRYRVSGVHLDDYFYPTDIGDGDHVWYRDYCKTGGTLSLHDWRCEQVNVLLRALYRTVHAFRQDAVFSVSPGGNPESVEAQACAQVDRWCGEPGFCDWIIPQLYYGFQNQTMPFAKTAKQWRTLKKAAEVKLISGLALYKVGKEDVYAGNGGTREWISNSGVIAKQVRLIRRLGYDGFALYSAQFVNFQEKVTAKACQMLERVL